MFEGGIMVKSEVIVLYFASLLGGLALCGARLGWLLFRVASVPPEDVAALNLWKLKRRWLIISELSALPAFATISVVLGLLQQWPVPGIILFSMVLGALGFAFFLDTLQTIVRRRIGMEKGDDNA